MKTIIFKLFLILVIVNFCSCNNEEIDSLIAINPDENPTDPDDVSEFNLLFIGNSLTYVNDLPNLVKSIAATNGKDLSVTTIANGNYALIDHWNDGIIQTYIESGDYDFVIVQQGPSSQPYGRELLFEYGGKISELCKDNDTKLAYYMVWPSLTYYSTFDGVIYSYTEAANRNNDILCPVGEVWKSYFDATNDFSYYGSDGFHPSLEGSKVAAGIIYESLFPE
jgi:hypothetical protein